jgi:hypothetical protein
MFPYTLHIHKIKPLVELVECACVFHSKSHSFQQTGNPRTMTNVTGSKKKKISLSILLGRDSNYLKKLLIP